MISLNWDITHYFVEATITIFVTTILVAIFAIYFSRALKNATPEKPLVGMAMLAFIGLKFFQNLVRVSLGRKFEWLSVYFFYLYFYLFLCNALSIIGSPFGNPTSFLVIIFSLGTITLIGILAFGFYFKGWWYFVHLLNPMNLMSVITSYVSLTFRLFGNIFAGFLILTLFYQQIGSEEHFTIFSVFASFLHIYFDLIMVGLQATVFVFLTLAYWSMERPENELYENEKTDQPEHGNPALAAVKESARLMGSGKGI